MTANKRPAGGSSIELQPKTHPQHTTPNHSPPLSPHAPSSSRRRPDSEKDGTEEIRPATSPKKSTTPLPKNDAPGPHPHAEEIRININKLSGGYKNGASGSLPGSLSYQGKTQGGKLDQPQSPGKLAHDRSTCQRLRDKCKQIRGLMKDNQLTTAATAVAVGSTALTATFGAFRNAAPAEGMGVVTMCLWCGVVYKWVSIHENASLRPNKNLEGSSKALNSESGMRLYRNAASKVGVSFHAAIDAEI